MRLSQRVRNVQRSQIKHNLPILNTGDTVRVGVVIQEAKKERIQNYQGTLLAKQCSGRNTTITVYRISRGTSVERSFPLHCPTVQSIIVLNTAKTRRSKLFFFRNRKEKPIRLCNIFTKISSCIKG